jgi:hypothetical protein
MTDNESPRLMEATGREIQLELIRRTQHNARDGKRVFEDLQSHRDLRKAVLIDKHPSVHLIKLRDLPSNDWSADTLSFW